MGEKKENFERRREEEAGLPIEDCRFWNFGWEELARSFHRGFRGFAAGGFGEGCGLGGQGVLGLAFSGGVGLGPGEKFAEVAVEVGRKRCSRFPDFLDDGVFHG